MKAKSEYRIGVGASSIVMMLVVLSLTAMCLLAFSSARNTKTLISRAQSMSVEYYRAADEAQRRFAALDQKLLELREKPDIDDKAFKKALRSLEGYEIAFNDAITFSFELDAGEERYLLVEGTISDLTASGERCRITKHTLVDAGSGFETDEYLDLIGDANGSNR